MLYENAMADRVDMRADRLTFLACERAPLQTLTYPWNERRGACGMTKSGSLVDSTIHNG